MLKDVTPCALVCVLLLAAAPIQAQVTTNWQTATDGLFNNIANWDNGVPTNGDTATFNVPGTYTVEFTANADSDTVSIPDGDVTFLSDGAKHTYTLTPLAFALTIAGIGDGLTLSNVTLDAQGAVFVYGGDSFYTHGYLNITNGAALTQDATQSLIIGFSDSLGEVRVTDTGSTLSTGVLNVGINGDPAVGSSELTIESQAQATVSRVTIEHGMVLVRSGATLHSTDSIFDIGKSGTPDSLASVFVRDAGSMLTSDAVITVVGRATPDDGRGELIVEDDATASLNRLIVSLTGEVSVTDAGSLTTTGGVSSVINGGAIFIDNATFNDNGITDLDVTNGAQLVIDNGGVLNAATAPIDIRNGSSVHLIDGTISTPDIVLSSIDADFQFGIGTLHFTTDKTITASNAQKLNIATLHAGKNLDVTGTLTLETNLDVNGGSLTATTLLIGEDDAVTTNVNSGAALEVNGPTRLGVNAAGNGSLTISGLGTTYDASGVEIGVAGTGAMVLSDGAQATSNDVLLGQFTNAVGSLTVSGPNTTWDAGITLIGTVQAVDNGGTGIFRVEDGATFNATFLPTYIGNGTGAVGIATVTDPGSTFSATGPLLLGNSGGTGTLNILDGGHANFFDDPTTINAGSTVHIDGGTLTTKALAGTGDLHLISGTLNLIDTTTIDTDLFDPNLTLGPGTAINVTNDATLAAPINAVINGGALSADMLTIDGSLTVNSGQVTAPAGVDNTGEIQLGNATAARINTNAFDNLGDLSGAGRITGTLSNTGSIDASAGTLRIDGVLSNRAGGIITLTGGQLRVANTIYNTNNGLILGNGTLRSDTSINNESNATMAFSGLTNILGDVTNDPGGLIISSGGGPVTFFDDVTNNGEIRTSDNSFTVFLGSYSGAGNLTSGPMKTGTVLMEGDLNPGNSPAQVQIDTNLALGNNANFHAELGGLLPGTEHDQVNITADVTLNGTLNVALLNNFDPTLGDTFTVMTWTGTRTGNFDTFQGVVLNPDGTKSLAVEVDDTLSQLRLTAAIPGDANLDGQVSIGDLSLLASSFGDTPGLGSWRAGDFNHDGQITIGDLSLLASNFGQTNATIGSGLTSSSLSLEAAAAIAGINLSTVPEPSAIVTVAGVVCIFLTRRS